MGEVVLVFDENKKRGFWKMGKIEGLVVGKDKVVRGATVKVMTKGAPVFIKRPVQKLYPIELKSERECRNEVGQEEEHVKVDKQVEEMGEVKEVDRTDGRRAKRAAALDAHWKIRCINKV